MDEHQKVIARRELAKREVVYRLPGVESVKARALTYPSADGTALPMTIYMPLRTGVRRTAAIVVALGYPDPDGQVRSFRPVTSWARLFAAAGMAAVVYGTRSPADDIDAVLQHLRREAPHLGLDAGRIGVFATSGNVPVALSALMRDRKISCAALLYGYTLDRDGSTAVDDVARQAGFTNASAGRSVEELPEAVPILLVRAGRDEFPSLNALLDDLVADAVLRNLPITLVNHATGIHGFDVYDDTITSHRVIQQVLAFVRIHSGEAVPHAVSCRPRRAKRRESVPAARHLD